MASISEYTARGKRGFVEFLVERYRGFIYLESDRAKRCWCWDDVTKLWTARDSGVVAQAVLAEVLPVAERELYELTRYDGELEKLVSKHLCKANGFAKFWKDARPAFEESLDADPDRLAIADGLLVDLASGQVRPRVRSDHWSEERPVRALPDSHPLANAARFYSDLMRGDPELLRLLQLRCGYLLTGRRNSRCLFVDWGPTASNGKSEQAALLQAILGLKLCRFVSRDVVVRSEGRCAAGAHTSYLADLKGLRVALLSEMRAGDQLNDEVLKELASQTGSLSVRQLGQAQSQMPTQVKVLVLSNHVLGYSSADQAVVDRVVLTPFLARFTDDGALPGERRRDPEFVRALQTTHLDEVFTWMLRGARLWYELGAPHAFPRPEACRQWLAEYVRRQRPIRYFVDSQLELVDRSAPPNNVKRSELLAPKELVALFERWCARKGLEATPALIKELKATECLEQFQDSQKRTVYFCRARRDLADHLADDLAQRAKIV